MRDLTPLVQEELARLPVTIDIHENQFLEGVWQQGREQGLELGRLTAARDRLTGLPEQKFGPMSAEVRQRIDHADFDQIQRWTRRVIPSSVLTDVFE